MVEWILVSIHPRTTIRHSWIQVICIRIHPLLGIWTHLIGILSISSHLKLIVVRHSIIPLLRRIKISGYRDVTRVLISPRCIGAPRLRPTSLIVASPLWGRKRKDITWSYKGLLVRYVGNVWSHIDGLFMLLLGDLSNVCKWIGGNIIAPHLLDIERRLSWSKRWL